MIHWPPLSLLALIVSAQGWGQGSPLPALSNGVIRYPGEDGRRQRINVGKPCSDLWVSPDGRVIAFIAIEKAEPPTPAERGPFIEESTAYIAWKSDYFKPVPLHLKPVSIDGNQWRVFRQPSVSPDLHTVYFLIPDTMTTWRLMSRSLSGGPLKTVGDVMTYCVIWGGSRSGDLLTMIRQDPGPSHPASGVTYPCYLSGAPGDRTMIADGVSQSCWAFGDFASRWSGKRGGACR